VTQPNTNALYVLAAGGTGGHLFPAQALAIELVRRGRRVVVMTDGRGRNYRADFPGADIATVPAASFSGRSPLGRVVALGLIGLGVVVALTKLVQLKPRAVIGFGGYPALPVMTAAWIAGIPSALHEQNAVLGRVNRRIAPHVKRIAASFPFARFAPKNAGRVVMTGNPVRPEAVALAGEIYAAPGASGDIRVLVFGGSQGARALSEIVPAALALLPQDLRARLCVVQQARAEDVDAVAHAYTAAGIRADVARFFDDLPKRMVRAHLVIARSGASTLGELTVLGRPGILIPYPFAMDDHQAANAAVLADAGAAWAIRQDTLDASKLAALLQQIFAAPEELQSRAKAAKALGRPEAARSLADLVETLGEAA
jgi:UDP-N-acetylglucosamine--N-acetylmuramyl-(pentapeptide) pyrophosphoryl-undecaprenol N-acetylglucosamine transferase